MPFSFVISTQKRKMLLTLWHPEQTKQFPWFLRNFQVTKFSLSGWITILMKMRCLSLELWMWGRRVDSLHVDTGEMWQPNMCSHAVCGVFFYFVKIWWKVFHIYKTDLQNGMSEYLYHELWHRREKGCTYFLVFQMSYSCIAKFSNISVGSCGTWTLLSWCVGSVALGFMNPASAISLAN